MNGFNINVRGFFLGKRGDFYLRRRSDRRVSTRVLRRFLPHGVAAVQEAMVVPTLLDLGDLQKRKKKKKKDGVYVSGERRKQKRQLFVTDLRDGTRLWQ
jgi:hypothetical protein